MRRLLAFVGVIALALGSAASAAESPAQVRKALQAMEDRANAASARKDVDAVLKTLTADFTTTDHKGRVMKRAQIEQQLRQVFQTVESFKGVGVVGAVKLPKPGVATATVKTKGVLVSRDPSTGKRVRLEMDAVSDDTWVRTKGQWLRRSSKTRSIRASRDGKPIEIP